MPRTAGIPRRCNCGKKRWPGAEPSSGPITRPRWVCLITSPGPTEIPRAAASRLTGLTGVAGMTEEDVDNALAIRANLVPGEPETVTGAWLVTQAGMRPEIFQQLERLWRRVQKNKHRFRRKETHPCRTSAWT